MNFSFSSHTAFMAMEVFLFLGLKPISNYLANPINHSLWKREEGCFQEQTFCDEEEKSFKRGPFETVFLPLGIISAGLATPLILVHLFPNSLFSDVISDTIACVDLTYLASKMLSFLSSDQDYT